MKKLHLSRNLMIAAILLIVAFQVYWLHKQYNDEYSSLKKEVDVTFRETIYKLQKQRFEKDTLLTGNILKETGFGDMGISKEGPAKVFIRQDHSDSEQHPMFMSRIVESPSGKRRIDSLDINPENIQSINVIKAGSNMPVPPPGLIEIFIKQKLKGDTNMVITRDSSGKKIITKVSFNGDYTYNYSGNGKDSGLSKALLKDRFRKMFAIGLKGAKGQNKTNYSSFTKGIIKGAFQSPIFRILSDSKSINDSIPVVIVDSAFKSELDKSNKKISYNIVFQKSTKEDAHKAEALKDTSKEFATSSVLVGYKTPYTYQAKFNNIFSFIVQKMGWQISGSFLLLAFVVISFISLYRNLLAQRRLALMKNEFISNITHELKTPIATVSVAIEALKNFGGITSPERTKEYLDISASELQRLSLLVDKVLKLSMFENTEIELKKEALDLRKLVDEVLNTMKLQFEKQQAIVELKTEGESFIIEADRLHIVSVLYNLLDNALKYSNGRPSIVIELKQLPNEITVSISDKGIGIPVAYQNKVFEKFFRVPTGNLHNVKGYGLGLSYVYHVINKHDGTISVQSEEGNGSKFIVKLPIAQ